MGKLKGKLLEGSKTRTNRHFTKFRYKCRPGDKMHIYIKQRTPEAEKLFDRICIERYFWDITEMPKTVLNAKNTESPKPGESWYEFAIRDGFSTYREFLDYFNNHPKGARFICYIWEKDKRNQKKLSEFIVK
jgi:hypothetical protein